MKRKIIYYTLLAITVLSCTKRTYIPEDVYYSVDFENSSKAVNKPRPSEENKISDKVPELNTINIKTSDKIGSVIDFAANFIGTPYKYGGTTPSGFDCSGFVMYIFKNNGVDMPRTTDGMLKISDKIDKKDIEPGDLVFFKGRNVNSNEIGHVALVTEKTKDGFKMIHSTSSKGVLINDFDQYEYWKTRYLFATRIKKEYL